MLICVRHWLETRGDSRGSSGTETQLKSKFILIPDQNAVLSFYDRSEEVESAVANRFESENI